MLKNFQNHVVGGLPMNDSVQLSSTLVDIAMVEFTSSVLENSQRKMAHKKMNSWMETWEDQMVDVPQEDWQRETKMDT